MSDLTLSILQFSCKRVERNLTRLREIFRDLQAIEELLENDRDYLENVVFRLKRDLAHERARHDHEVKKLKENNCDVIEDGEDEVDG